MKAIYIILISILINFNLYAQEQWMHYIYTGRIQSITRENNFIWAGGVGGVVKWNIDDGSSIKYTNVDGLAENCVRAIAIDAEGNKWFGTEGGGVTKFDGTNWLSYSKDDGLNSYTVNAITIDHEGNIWFGTDNGVTKFDGTNWTSYGKWDDLNLYSVEHIAIDTLKNIWFGSLGGVTKFDGLNWTHYDISIYSMAADSAGNIWFGGFMAALQFDGTNWKEFKIDTGSDPIVRSITVDADNIKWFATANGVYSLKDTTFNHYTANDGLANNDIQTIFIDKKNIKWFGHWSKITQFDGQNYSIFKTQSEIGIYIPSSVTIDLNGHIWIGSEWMGISEFDGQLWNTYIGDENDEAYQDINDIAVDLNNVKWFATEYHVLKFDGFSSERYYPKDGLCSTPVSCVAIDMEGIKWFGTYSGISRFDDSNWTTYKVADGLISNSVNKIMVDKNNNKWFGTNSGVSKFDGINWTNYTLEDGLISNCILDIDLDKFENIWFGTAEGISKFDGTNWTNYTTANGLPYKSVHCIAIDSSNTKWIFSALHSNLGALSKFDDYGWKTYPTSEGFLGPIIEDIAVDKENNKWFINGGGVTKLTNTPNNVKQENFKNITFNLLQNYPNPFNASTFINYSISNKNGQYIEIFISNILGQRVKTLFTGLKKQGNYSLIWSGKDELKQICTSGIYFCILESTDAKIITKMLLIR